MSRVRIRCKYGGTASIRCWPAPKFFGVDGFVFHRSLTSDPSVKSGFRADGQEIVYTHKETGFRAGIGDSEQDAVTNARARIKAIPVLQSPSRRLLNAIEETRAAIADGSWRSM